MTDPWGRDALPRTKTFGQWHDGITSAMDDIDRALNVEAERTLSELEARESREQARRRPRQDTMGQPA